MKNQFINALTPGDDVDDIFMLVEKRLAKKKNGEPFLNIVLTDKTGRLNGVAWDDVDNLAAVQTGRAVRVKGSASEYRDALQLTVREMTVLAEDAVDPADFLPATTRNTDQMFDRLVGLCDKIRNPHIKRLLAAFWNDADFVRRFKIAPAAKGMHHAYLGGLLEHTLSMTILVDRIAGHYAGVDMDLLRAGAVFHDIGKIREFEYERVIDYSDQGRLLSHIVIGCQMLDEKLTGIEGFPAETALLLKHLVVSHHGTREFGSPEPPKTIEAILLNYIDDIDAKVNGIREFMGKEKGDDAWTGYHKLLARHFYRGGPAPEEEG